MLNKSKTLILIGLTLSLSVFAKQKVVYGVDNRVEVYEANNTLHEQAAQATAAMISDTKLSRNGETYTINSGTLESRGICPTSRFAKQISASSCTGFLVTPTLLVTAGHCMRNSFQCDNFKWIFDYSLKEEGDAAEFTIPSSNVYSCKRIVETVLDFVTKNDYAVIELDRPINDRTPLKIRQMGKVDDSAPVFVTGHPSGLPMKVADGGWVRNNTNSVYFQTNIDAFGGNSGSPVMNSETGLVEGILVRGEIDYTYDSRGCRVPKICDEDKCRGEDVTRITEVKYLMEPTMGAPAE